MQPCTSRYSRIDRCNEELHIGPRDLQQYEDTYAGYVKRMDAVVACLDALLRSGFNADCTALDPTFTCPRGDCEKHVHELISRGVHTLSDARGALEAAKRGREVYCELLARGRAALALMRTSPTLPSGRTGGPVKDAKSAVSAMMQDHLRASRNALGLPAVGGRGVPPLYSRRHDVRGASKEGLFAEDTAAAVGEFNSTADGDEELLGLDMEDDVEQLLADMLGSAEDDTPDDACARTGPCSSDEEDDEVDLLGAY